MCDGVRLRTVRAVASAVDARSPPARPMDELAALQSMGLLNCPARPTCSAPSCSGWSACCLPARPQGRAAHDDRARRRAHALPVCRFGDLAALRGRPCAVRRPVVRPRLRGVAATSSTACRRLQPVHRQVGALVRVLRGQRLVDLDAVARRLARVQVAVLEACRRAGTPRRSRRCGACTPGCRSWAPTGRSAAPRPCTPATGRSRRGSRCAPGSSAARSAMRRRCVMPPACTTVVRM